MDETFHYPPELLQLLVDTIPRLVKSKKDVLLFFKGAGVPDNLYQDLEARVKHDPDRTNKFEIARTVLTRLNEGGERTLRQRREVIKQVTEFHDYSTAWPDDQLKAQGLVARVREVVNVKDSFTRMNIERERERRQRQAEQQARLRQMQARRQEIESLKDDFYRLFSIDDPHRRGKALEGLLNQLFGFSNTLVRESFANSGSAGEGIVEQIDGAIEIDGTIYLVEMKWWQKPLGTAEVSPHLVRVYGRGNVGGILISASGFTEPAITTCRDALAQKVVVLCDLEEVVMLLEREGELLEMLRSKIRAASIDKNPYFNVTGSAA